jgi:hypothetical protein
MREDMERLAADFPGWRIECTTGGTRYYSAHRGEGDEAVNLGATTIHGLAAMLDRQEGGTVAELGARVADAGF